MSDYRLRLIDEHEQLYKKIAKLKEFIISGKCDELPEIDKYDLKEQLGHMENYFDVLDRRVSRNCNNA